MWFAADSFPHPVRAEVLDAFRAAWDALGAPGAWWDGPTRLAIAREAREAAPRGIGVLRPDPDTLAHPDDVASGCLSPLVAEIVRRVTAEAPTLTRGWFERVAMRVGVAPYAEIVGIVVTVVPIDRFCRLLGRAPEPFPPALPGSPSREYPSDVAEDGAWLPMTVPWERANVARALSVVPREARVRYRLIQAMYSRGEAFARLDWSGWPLTRPQVELLAARTSALNQCFY